MKYLCYKREHSTKPWELVQELDDLGKACRWIMRVCRDLGHSTSRIRDGDPKRPIEPCYFFRAPGGEEWKVEECK